VKKRRLRPKRRVRRYRALTLEDMDRRARIKKFLDEMDNPVDANKIGRALNL
jgi:hypothetical protein